MSEQDKLEQAIAIQESMRGTIPDEVVDVAITALRKQIAELQPVQTNEQRKHLTLLHTGLSGFTAQTEQMDAEELSQVMSVYYDAVTPSIQKYGGMIEKRLGDTVMAVFGLPQAHENDPENSIRAALEMQQALVTLNERMENEWGFRLNMRVGISTGPVLARTMGSGDERDFSVIGSTVNIVNRIEKITPDGGILISHDTFSKIELHRFGG
ncbi:MAG: adenylate/guanylate cyclase domain-containing protein, partial [Anaerolineales bacterium]